MGGLPFPEEERGMGGGGVAEVGNRRLGGEETGRGGEKARKL